MKNPLDRFLDQTGRWLNIIGGTALTAMMGLTVADVILRAFGHPILGTYEMVSYLLALVAGFTIPRMSLDRVHVNMDFILLKLPPGDGPPWRFLPASCCWFCLRLSASIFF